MEAGNGQSDAGRAGSSPATGSTSREDSRLERRRRILATTRELARAGGYDAVQMRAVADGADVALGTLYRYFPSKTHLLVEVLEEELVGVRERLAEAPVAGATAADRVVAVLHAAGADLQGDPRLTEAVTRAFMFADHTVSEPIHRVLDLFTGLVAGAIRRGDPSPEDRALAEVVADLWFAAMVAWVNGRLDDAGTSARMEAAVRLVLRD
ncbi:TetR family transcriptional regulator [Nocardioides solisilvae]|uniref:TetR family transcriptional regulator n=1 Tax=Nocardioides solisilvae TaxID=1542435 RepID=UPI000D742707|nr:TetR family transcriptional regulator [Nocardioides solisilvae]